MAGEGGQNDYQQRGGAAPVALKKSDLYSSLWKSCDELRGGMDASQYKDYILTLLFMNYVSDKAKADPDSLIDVPKGGSFDDMLAAETAATITCGCRMQFVQQRGQHLRRRELLVRRLRVVE
jgi:HsdM N-terminal domain